MKQRIFILLSALTLLASWNVDAAGDESAAASDASQSRIATAGQSEGAHTTTTPQQLQSDRLTSIDVWLMILAGIGLIVLQLRRKQKTLPQRPLIHDDKNLTGEITSHRHTDAVVDLTSHS